MIIYNGYNHLFNNLGRLLDHLSTPLSEWYVAENSSSKFGYTGLVLVFPACCGCTDDITVVGDASDKSGGDPVDASDEVSYLNSVFGFTTVLRLNFSNL
tara:strand:+ start:1689 stop:1985 length:297 start_codon:yes stop_codon:yes gene_type:complete